MQPCSNAATKEVVMEHACKVGKRQDEDEPALSGSWLIARTTTSASKEGSDDAMT